MADTSGGGGSDAATLPQRRAKDIFGDCALVEIIHLHDCFRGALKNLEVDVSELCREIAIADAANLRSKNNKNSSINGNCSNMPTCAADGRICDLERRVAGRFTVIWSVFRAHSAAEDEFIWPALKAKQVAVPGCDRQSDPPIQPVARSRQVQQQVDQPDGAEEVAPVRLGMGAEQADNYGEPQHPQEQQLPQQPQRERALSVTVHTIEQEEYEEDHADEERMFNSINDLLSNLRDELSIRRNRASSPESASCTGGSPSLRNLAQNLLEGTANLMRHLMAHLDKEETHCMPLVAQYLTKVEINDLVGKIMGKRSSELMSQILTMAVQNLEESDRDDMVRYMKQAMVGTFFERWLKMGGWISESSLKKSSEADVSRDKKLEESDDGGGKIPAREDGQGVEVAEPAVAKTEMNEAENDIGMASSNKVPLPPSTQENDTFKASASLTTVTASAAASAAASSTSAVAAVKSHDGDDTTTKEKYTSAAELEKLIRAIGTNPHLDSKQKNLTIQGLRDSVWKRNCRLSKRKREEGITMAPPAQVARTSSSTTTSGASGACAGGTGAIQASTAQQATTSTGGENSHQAHHMCFPVSPATRFKRETPPSSYYKKTVDGEVKLVWSSDPRSPQPHPTDGSVPLFSASELAPTYHDGGINHVLGCPHYARSCKLRHPTSGRLYTCRLCCEQRREMATKDKDSPLDRYEVSEILCMQCGALQPAGDSCVNPKCHSAGKPFARYTCKICNFYDDSSDKSIYHCPFCNVCRSGKGLGIDYRHCMRCNACVSLKDEHHCIPQRLQGNCPICHETMFQSTEPLRGLRCGHVMHLSCFSMYMRGHSYTCPLCKKSAEDMSEYFALLDSAVRMQPMPPAYAATTSNIYCQDCCKMGNVSYHFVGLKCHHCGSYNTRELQRVDANIMASLWQGH